MKFIALIAISLIALSGIAGCGNQDEKKITEPSQKPVSASSPATATGSANATADESPTMPADEEVASTAAAESETAAESADANSESPDEPAEKPESAETPAPKTAGAIGAVALAQEFEKDKAAAEKKYQNMAVLVEGKVGMYLASSGYIYLTGSNDVRNVICILKSPTSEKIKYGDTVVAKGKFDLVAVLGVSLKDCELVKVNP